MPAHHRSNRAVFLHFVRLCRELDLYGRELIAVDVWGANSYSSHNFG